MDFISNKGPQIAEMLNTLGLTSVLDLFKAIPDKIRVPPPSNDDGISEYEGMRLMESIASMNSYPAFDNYLGAGAYEHHIPAIVQAICAKSEFLTSYTPYQAEASQGMLQIIFEYQSIVCALTGMDVSNASLYDGASACAEAALMSLRIHKERNRILIAKNFHPHYRSVVEQYVASHGTKVETLPYTETGQVDIHALENLLDGSAASIFLACPNFLGVFDDYKTIFKAAKNAGVLSILCANPLAYGLFASAEDVGADIAVGDMQPFGLPLQFGGPYCGYMACKKEFMRQLPGRIAGETVDKNGQRGFVLTLQAREQHIRREKATSNICTNQALAALASTIAVLWYGKEGIQKLALTNYQRAAYLREKMSSIKKFKILDTAPTFNEFAIHFGRSAELVFKVFRENSIEPGLELGRFYPEWEDYFLVAVTETKNKAQLDKYFETAKRLL